MIILNERIGRKRLGLSAARARHKVGSEKAAVIHDDAGS